MDKQPLSRIAYIIPTKDRPDDLRKLLISLQNQTVKADQIIIVDGGDKDIKNIVDDFPGLGTNYLRVRPPGLTRQRNAGKMAVKEDVSLVGYLDDDIVMENNANEIMLNFFQDASADHAGASFNIVNNIENRGHLFKRVFLIDSRRKGTVLTSGMHTILHPVEKDTFVQWLSGGATVWRRQIIDSYNYDENYRGYGHFDDLDFSFRVNTRYKLKVLRDARVWHYIAYPKTNKKFDFAVSDAINRFYFVRKFPDRMKISHFFWATFGMIMMCFGLGIKHRDKGHFLRALGYIAGLYKIATGDFCSHNTNIKF